MEQIKIIPPYIHGVVDYLSGIVLLLAPNIFGFADFGDAALWIPRILGIAILGMAALTDYRVGLMRVIPLEMHLTVDYIAGFSWRSLHSFSGFLVRTPMYGCRMSSPESVSSYSRF